MTERDKRETVTHHTMSAVGGFLVAYAFLLRDGVAGSAATGNLVGLLMAGLNGSTQEVLIRAGVAGIYTAGIVTATLTRRHCQSRGRDFRYWAIAIDAVACPILALIPETAEPLLALYPMFFATAFHWMAFYIAAGINASTIFSTNNLRQTAEGLTEYLCTREPAHLRKFCFYGGTLLCFQIGAGICWLFVRQWHIAGIYGCLLLIAMGLAALLRENGILSPYPEAVKK